MIDLKLLRSDRPSIEDCIYAMSNQSKVNLWLDFIEKQGWEERYLTELVVVLKLPLEQTGIFDLWSIMRATYEDHHQAMVNLGLLPA